MVGKPSAESGGQPKQEGKRRTCTSNARPRTRRKKNVFAKNVFARPAPRITKVMQPDQNPFQKTKRKGERLKETNSCCHTPRADRSRALMVAQMKAAREAFTSPWMQQMLPPQTIPTEKAEAKLKERLGGVRRPSQVCWRPSLLISTVTRSY